MCYLGSFSKKKRKRKSAILVVTWNLVYIRYWCTLLKTITWLCCRSDCRDKGIIDEDCKRQIIASHICSNLIQKKRIDPRSNRPSSTNPQPHTHHTSTNPRSGHPFLTAIAPTIFISFDFCLDPNPKPQGFPLGVKESKVVKEKERKKKR